MKKINYTLIVLLILISSISAFGQQFKVMVYTGPDRWHDRSIPIAITEFKEMAIKHHFELVWAQKNGSGSLRDPFSTEFLEGVDAIVFLNSKGEDLTETQKENFKTFIRNG